MSNIEQGMSNCEVWIPAIAGMTRPDSPPTADKCREEAYYGYGASVLTIPKAVGFEAATLDRDDL